MIVSDSLPRQCHFVSGGGQFARKVDAIVKEKAKYWVHDIKTVSS
jgi:hypothetical protein